MIAVIVRSHRAAGSGFRGRSDERRRHRRDRQKQLGGDDEINLQSGAKAHVGTVGRTADKCKDGALYLIRTDDPFITNEVLYQLS